jgi:hypothetical protein
MDTAQPAATAGGCRAVKIAFDRPQRRPFSGDREGSKTEAGEALQARRIGPSI